MCIRDRSIGGQVKVKFRTVSALILGIYFFRTDGYIGQYGVFSLIGNITVGLVKVAVVKSIKFYIKYVVVPSRCV